MWKKWLIGILLLAAAFRLIGLTKSPPGLNWDEVSIGYNAYSILKTGKDEWGEFLPLSFKAFGEAKLPGMIYASVPGIALFGTTDFGVRVTPAIIGILGVYLLYLLAKQLFRDEKIALAAAALLAISPWAVHFSRVSFEAGLAMVLTILSVYCVIKAKENPRLLWLAMITAILAAYTYNSVRILLPLLFLTYLKLGVIDHHKKDWKKLGLVSLIGITLCLPIFLQLADPAGRVRWGTVAFSDQRSFYENVAVSRGFTTLPGILPRLLQNKFTHYLSTFGSNYIQSFSTEFLFFTGSENTQRSVQEIGLLYLFELPLLVAGFLYLLNKKRDAPTAFAAKVLLPWLLLAPIPSALTIDAPSSVRALGMLPPLLLIEGLGVAQLANLLQRSKVWKWIILLFVIWNISYFAYKQWYVYPVKYASDWQYGYKQAAEFAGSHYGEAEAIYMTTNYGEPYIYILFYTGYDPRRFQTETVNRSTDPTGWIHVESFDKFHFTGFSGLETPREILARGKGKIVMIDSFATLPGDMHRDLVIQAPNWKVMFEGTVQQAKNPGEL